MIIPHARNGSVRPRQPDPCLRVCLSRRSSLLSVFFVTLPRRLCHRLRPCPFAEVLLLRSPLSGAAGRFQPVPEPAALGTCFGGRGFNAAPCFTITCQSTSCVGFLEEIFVPSRCSVGSTLHYPEPAKDELLVQESVKPSVVSSPRSGSWSWALLLCHLVLSLYSVPGSSQICVFRPLCFCAISASFLPLFLQFFTGVPISGPALESASNVSSQSPLAPSSYSACICQTEQLFSPNPNNPSPSHMRFGVNPFLAQMVICRICWGFAMTCLWGRVLVFWSLFWVTSKRWKHGSAEVKPPILVGQDIAHRPPGMVLALMRSIAVGDVWIQLDPGLEDWETKQEELHLQLDEKVHFLPSLCLD